MGFGPHFGGHFSNFAGHVLGFFRPGVVSSVLSCCLDFSSQAVSIP